MQEYLAVAIALVLAAAALWLGRASRKPGAGGCCGCSGCGSCGAAPDGSSPGDRREQ